MRVGLFGFGKTGKAVASVILRNKEIVLEWVIRKTSKLEHRSVPEFLGEESNEPGLIYSADHTDFSSLLDEQPVDAIIDFSSESGLDYYGAEAVKRNIIIISAISHYSEKSVAKLKKLSENIPVFWSPNITLGINYLIVSAKYLKKIAPMIDFAVVEEHFKDKPEISGTAKAIARNLDIQVDEIKSVRAGGIIGKHEIICGFPFQTVRLVHESITREAFGNGAIFVAKSMNGRDKGFYTFEELLLPYFMQNPY